MGKEGEINYTTPNALKIVGDAITNTYRLKPDKYHLSLKNRIALNKTIKELEEKSGIKGLKQPTEDTFNQLLQWANGDEYRQELLNSYANPGYYTNYWQKGYKPWGNTYYRGCKTCGNVGKSVTIGGELPYITRDKRYISKVKWEYPNIPPEEQPSTPPMEPPVSEQPHYYVETVKEEVPYEKEIIYDNIDDILKEINQFQTKNGWKYEVRQLPVPWSEEKINKYSEIIKRHREKNPSQYQVPYNGVTSVSNPALNYETGTNTMYTQNYYDQQGNLVGKSYPDSTNLINKRNLDLEVEKGKYQINQLPDTVSPSYKNGNKIRYINFW